jgi:hypothetical protein
MEKFEEMGGTIRGQAVVGPVQMSRGGDTLRTGWVSGRTYIMKAGTFVIMCRIFVDFPKLAFQVLGAVRLELGVGGPEPGVLVSLCGLHLDGLSLILGRAVFVIVIFGVNSRRLARSVVW